MKNKIQNKKYIYILFTVVLIVVLAIFFVAVRYPKPLLKPQSILKTKIISDKNAKHSCQVTPFTQEITYLEEAVYEVDLLPSREDSYYFLEVGELPPGLVASWDNQEGKGAPNSVLRVTSLNASKTGSFTLTVAYHEWQGLNKWLVNYCLFNVVVVKQE